LHGGAENDFSLLPPGGRLVGSGNGNGTGHRLLALLHFHLPKRAFTSTAFVYTSALGINPFVLLHLALPSFLARLFLGTLHKTKRYGSSMKLLALLLCC
jgi:hypothetical protein